MPRSRCAVIVLVLALATLSLGCRPAAKGPRQVGSESSADLGQFPLQAGDYTVLGILTDNKDDARAKANAEDTLTRHPDIACMVGLWAYNPPAILSAVRGAGKVGEVKIIGFDEHKETLEAIESGEIFGTIVQQPFLFGYKSVEYLAALARGQDVDVPESKMIYVPHSVIQQENVQEFGENIDRILADRGTPPEHDREYDTSEPVKVCFLTNSVDNFWVLAQKGCELAQRPLNAECLVYMPPSGTVEEQKRKIEELIAGQYQGLAISPIDPANQTAMINQAAEVMPVIAQDSDAPESKRLFYIGTSNYLAGRAAGKLVKEAAPEGGKVMIFVGKMEVLNAQERSRGVIDELRGAPIPPEFADQ